MMDTGLSWLSSAGGRCSKRRWTAPGRSGHGRASRAIAVVYRSERSWGDATVPLAGQGRARKAR